ADLPSERTAQRLGGTYLGGIANARKGRNAIPDSSPFSFSPLSRFRDSASSRPGTGAPPDAETGCPIPRAARSLLQLRASAAGQLPHRLGPLLHPLPIARAGCIGRKRGGEGGQRAAAAPAGGRLGLGELRTH